MDGAFSDNLPTLDENTVTVSPFAGETDICPRDDSAQIFHVSNSRISLEIKLFSFSYSFLFCTRARAGEFIEYEY